MPKASFGYSYRDFKKTLNAVILIILSLSPSNTATQVQLAINLAEEQSAAIAADVAAGKIGFNFTTFNRRKIDGSLVAFCHGGSSCLFGFYAFIFKNFPPFFYPPS